MSIWDVVAGPLISIIEKYVPDPQQKAAAQAQLLQLQQAEEFKQIDAQVAIAKGQTDTNAEEAKSSSLFISGWRPWIGWVCGLGLFSQFIVGPFATWTAALLGHSLQFPALDMGTLMTLLVGMLGLGGMRTVEKINGVAAK